MMVMDAYSGSHHVIIKLTTMDELRDISLLYYEVGLASRFFFFTKQLSQNWCWPREFDFNISIASQQLQNRTDAMGFLPGTLNVKVRKISEAKVIGRRFSQKSVPIIDEELYHLESNQASKPTASSWPV